MKKKKKEVKEKDSPKKEKSKKHSVKHHVKHHSIHHSISGNTNEAVLVENFVALQKVMTDLSIKFNNLNDQISKLLNLFESSAKALAEKDYDFEAAKKDNKEMIKKLDNLFEQNKVLAKGITYLHDKPMMEDDEEISELPVMKPKMTSEIPVPRPIPQMQRNIFPRPSILPPQNKPVDNIDQYQKSLPTPIQDEGQ